MLEQIGAVSAKENEVKITKMIEIINFFILIIVSNKILFFTY